MPRLTKILIVLFALITIAPATSAGGAARGRPHNLVTPRAMTEWTKVAVCEEGGWHNAHGPAYFGALGWLDATWLAFKAPWMPRYMDEAIPQEQVWAALQFTKHYHFVPDQHGCTGGY